MSASLRLQWCDGVSASVANDELIVESPAARIKLRPQTSATRDAILRFLPPGEDEDHLAEIVADGNGGLSRWYYLLGSLTRRGLVCYSLHSDGKLLATLLPISPTFVTTSIRPVIAERYVLSRFAFIRRCGTNAVLESPLAHARVILDDVGTAALAAQLATPATVEELASRNEGLSQDAITGVLALLLRAGMLQNVRPDGTVAEDDDPSLQTWAFHDLLFHSRSRKGRTDAAYGGTYRFAGHLGPPPALKQPPSGEVYELFQPDLDRLMREDPPFAQVQEQRYSARTFARDRPITEQQLGEFLFRVGRVRNERKVEIATPAGPVQVDMVSRPYPSGGSLYEQEIYIAVKNCVGLPLGLYHYDPLKHRLVRLKTQEADVLALLEDSMKSTGTTPDELQVLIILAARFPRLAWKYESIAYALILKHVGVLYQTMYLAATAMGLASCAIGGGDSDLFARAAQTQYCAETSVGEFLLGSAKSCPPSCD